MYCLSCDLNSECIDVADIIRTRTIRAHTLCSIVVSQKLFLATLFAVASIRCQYWEREGGAKEGTSTATAGPGETFSRGPSGAKILNVFFSNGGAWGNLLSACPSRRAWAKGEMGRGYYLPFSQLGDLGVITCKPQLKMIFWCIFSIA